MQLQGSLYNIKIGIGDGSAKYSKDKIELARISLQRKLLEKAQRDSALLSKDELNKVIYMFICIVNQYIINFNS